MHRPDEPAPAKVLVKSYETRTRLRQRTSTLIARIYEQANNYCLSLDTALTDTPELQLWAPSTPQFLTLFSDMGAEVLFETAALTPPFQNMSWLKDSTNAVTPVGGGQVVDVYRSRCPRPWTLVAARPRSTWEGLHIPGFNVYFRNLALAAHLAGHLRTGQVQPTPPALGASEHSDPETTALI